MVLLSCDFGSSCVGLSIVRCKGFAGGVDRFKIESKRCLLPVLYAIDDPINTQLGFC